MSDTKQTKQPQTTDNTTEVIGAKSNQPEPQAKSKDKIIDQETPGLLKQLAAEIKEFQGRDEPLSNDEMAHLKELWEFYSQMAASEDVRSRLKATFHKHEDYVFGKDGFGKEKDGQLNVLLSKGKVQFIGNITNQDAINGIEHLMMQGYDVMVFNKIKDVEQAKMIAKAIAKKNFELKTTPGMKEAMGMDSVSVKYNKPTLGKDYSAILEQEMANEFERLMQAYGHEQKHSADTDIEGALSGDGKALPEMINDRIQSFEDVIQATDRELLPKEVELVRELSKLQGVSQKAMDTLKDNDLSKAELAKTDIHSYTQADHVISEKLSYEPAKLDDYIRQGKGTLDNTIDHDLKKLEEVNGLLIKSVGDVVELGDVGVSADVEQKILGADQDQTPEFKPEAPKVQPTSP